jgi:hypothetical protein
MNLDFQQNLFIHRKGGNPVIARFFLDSAKASLRARLSAPLRPE